MEKRGSFDDFNHSENIAMDLTSHLKERTHPTLLVDIDPKRCKPWRYHNRDGAWLTRERCADLIHSLQRDGQLEPILVRALSGDPDADYEIIYGVRRAFACAEIPNQHVVARITDLDDKSCMILMHSENANSKDISDFERAFSFAQQMKSGYFKNQTEMAETMGLSQGTISKMIHAAEIFELEWIAELFQTKIDIPIKAAYTVSLLLKGAESRARIKTEAFYIQQSIKEIGFLPAPKVLHRLIASAKGDAGTPFESVILTVDNSPIVCCRQEKSGKFMIVIENEAKKLTAVDIETACLKALREHVLHALFPGNKNDLR
ncbi:MAG TPA: ParB/RepB/Spo0J family partition protein [Gammaproteobacteria bacterium]|nr:ParB/RepB/Spo0J family partition protein [Gammaproteobacteria bacterium]